MVHRSSITPKKRIQKDTSSATDTIAAISTSTAVAAIGIVRLSGPRALEIAAKIFKPSKNKSLKKIQSFSMLHGIIIDDDMSQVDEVLLSFMKGPKSYTAEDIIEINCHGGPVVLRSILRLALQNGARLAEPGEFTKRAFLNGRIDLLQAEAVIDVIEAKTQAALKAAQKQLQGRLSSIINELRTELIGVSVQLQAAIDFSDEDIETENYAALIKRILISQNKLESLLQTKNEGALLRDGIKTAIIGGPNVGKSSLLNALLNNDRAIVTEIAGTTRDILEEIINIEGLPLMLQDTAGIRDAFDIAEKKGIDISKKALDSADLVLLVVDSSKGFGKVEIELAKRASSKNTICVLNKTDLINKIDAHDLKAAGIKNAVKVSALKLQGLEKLKKKIVNMCLEHNIEPEDVLINNVRQAHSLEKGIEHITQAKYLLKKGESEELVSFEINAAIKSLGQIIGEVSAEDVLDQLFSQFCIGK